MKRSTRVGDTMTPEDAAACRAIEQQLAEVMMRGQYDTGDASLGMTALINVLAYGMASLFDTSEAAMAHLHMVLEPEIARHIKLGAHANVVNVASEVGHA